MTRNDLMALACIEKARSELTMALACADDAAATDAILRARQAVIDAAAIIASMTSEPAVKP